MNNYNKFKDLGNNVEFFSFNRNDYIKEANKIMSQRLIDKNADLVGKRSQDKINIISNTREISRNNFVIDAIKKNINNIKLIEKNYKLISPIFINFLIVKMIKSKKKMLPC